MELAKLSRRRLGPALAQLDLGYMTTESMSDFSSQLDRVHSSLNPSVSVIQRIQ